jgi:nitrite reductase/ring-hydroxylating ferredoxin subunit
MADTDQVHRHESAEKPQALIGFMPNDEWDALLAHVNGLIQQMDELPEDNVKTAIFELLDGIDAIHREALLRLVRLFKEGVLEQVATDPAIHTLLELYDMLPQQPEEVERVHAAPSAKPRDPHWVPVLQRQDELSPGTAREFVVADSAVLLCRRADLFFALESFCAQDGASLSGATLSGYTLTCPNHPACHYDVRRGKRVGSNEVITCYPVKQEEDGRVLVGFDMDFTPSLPSF